MNRRMIQKSNFKFKQFSLKQKKVLTWWHFKNEYDGIICDGAIRCVEGNTLIYDPVKNKHIKIKDYTGGHVLSFDGEKMITAKATKSVKFKKVPLYEVTLESGKKIIVSSGHRFLTTLGWKDVKSILDDFNEIKDWNFLRYQLYSFESCQFLSELQEFQKESTLEPFQLTQHEDDQNFLKKPQDFEENCLIYHHPYDELLRADLSIYQERFPSQDDALEHIRKSLKMDVQEHELNDNHFCQLSDQFYKSENFYHKNLDVLFHWFCIKVLFRNVYTSCELLLRSFLTNLQFVEQYFLCLLTNEFVQYRLCYNDIQTFLSPPIWDNNILHNNYMPHKEKIQNIKFLKEDYYYDLHVPVYENYLANGFINHNSGKTISLATSFVVWAMSSFNNQAFAMCGKTIGSFRRNVWMWLKQALIALGYSISELKTENLVTITFGEVTNQIYFFGGRDESSADLIQGLTLAGILFDEVALMPESFVNQATGRCSVEGFKFWFNCNPDSPSHWFKLQWIDKLKEKNLLRLHFMMDDNLTLSEAIKEKYKNRYSGLFYKRFILGLWVIADGIIFDMFNESKHVVKTEDRNYSEYYISCDYGTYNPCVFGLYGKLRDIWYKVDEYYFSGRESEYQKTDNQYADDMIKFINNRMINGIVVDPSASSFITELKSRNIAKVYKAKNDVGEGIKRYSTILNEGKILFNDCCKNSFREFSSYIWDDKAGNKGQDKPLKINDHTKDEERYFINTIVYRREIKMNK